MQSGCVKLGGLGLLAALGLALGGNTLPLKAGDWPQILGPSRSGIATDEQLPATWPASGPPKIWATKLGSGYAGPAVLTENGVSRVVAFHREGTQERIEAFDPASGKSLWQANFPATYRGGINPDKGPRCVPLLAAGKVYAFGAGGDLHCVQLADGKPVWSRELYADYQGDEGYFGAGSTPILMGKDKLLINVGGKKAGIVALNALKGKTLWQATSEIGSYASPTTIAWNGKQAALFVTRLNAVVVNPDTGDVLATTPFGARGPTVNAATPLVFDSQVFLSASYGVGAMVLKVGKNGWEKTWANDKSLSSQYATAVYFQGHLYGTHGREDAGAAELRCVEATTGNVVWSQPRFPISHAILVGDKLLLVGIDGSLKIVSASPKGYQVLAEAEVPADKGGETLTRALPALSQGVLYLRTNAGDGGELIAIRVGK